jgi:hypothetical protein
VPQVPGFSELRFGFLPSMVALIGRKMRPDASALGLVLFKLSKKSLKKVFWPYSSNT